VVRGGRPTGQGGRAIKQWASALYESAKGFGPLPMILLDFEMLFIVTR
jgi:hypothetical protein